MIATEWAALGVGAAGVALLELDVVLAGQFLVSRPIVVGPLLGFLLGHPLQGWAFGVLYELFDIGEPPIGGHMPPNATVATGAAVLLASGPTGLPDPLAFALGLAAGWAHRAIELRLRGRRRTICETVEARLARGQEPGWAGVILPQLAVQAAATFALLGLSLAARPALAALWEGAPYPLDAGTRAAFAAAPWIGLVALMKAARL